MVGMRSSTHFFIFLSASLGALAFLYPPMLWWLALIFLMPLFYAFQHMHPTALQGFMWGCLFFGLHFMAVIPLLFRMREGWSSIMGYLALIIFFSTMAAGWFWLAHWLLRITKGSFFSFAIATFLFFAFLSRACLFIFGRVEGVLLINPLLPLAQMPQTLAMLHLLGAEGLLAILILLQSYRKWSLVFIAPFIVGWVWQPTLHKPPINLNEVGYISARPWPHQNPCEITQEISQKIRELKKHRPDIRLILMPESSCCFPVNSCPHASEILLQGVSNDLTLLFGGHHEVNEENETKLHNCLYLCNNLLITKSYAKAKLIPFVESVPSPFNYSAYIKNIFLNGHKEFKEAENEISCRLCTIDVGHSSFQLIPQICWELYVAAADPCPQAPKNVPVLALVNDSWYASYYQRLLFLGAKFQSLHWHRPIFYIAHTGAWWLDGAALKPLHFW